MFENKYKVSLILIRTASTIVISSYKIWIGLFIRLRSDLSYVLWWRSHHLRSIKRETRLPTAYIRGKIILALSNGGGSILGYLICGRKALKGS